MLHKPDKKESANIIYHNYKSRARICFHSVEYKGAATHKKFGEGTETLPQTDI